MGGGNGQKAKMAREKNLEKSKAAGKGTHNTYNHTNIDFFFCVVRSVLLKMLLIFVDLSIDLCERFDDV